MEKQKANKQLKQVEFALRIKRAHKKGSVFLTDEGLKHVELLAKGK